jgi:quercetin dioxygenase-like cupin family protein
MSNSELYCGKIEDLPILEGGEDSSISKRVIFGPGKHWDSHVMRVFTVKPGSATPFHSHDWPHYMIFLKGMAKGLVDNDSAILEKGDFAYVPPNVEHNFKNIGDEDLMFICIVPRKGDSYLYPDSEK